MRTLSTVFAAAALAAGCASPDTADAAAIERRLPNSVSHALEQQAPPRVEAVYTDGVVTLSLRNTDFAEASAAAQRPANLKYAPQDDFNRLIAAWDQLQFFDRASAAAQGRPKAQLALRINGSEWVRTRQDGSSDVADITAFNGCVAAFQQVYNTTLSFQAINNLPAEHFEAERDRAQKKRAEALRKLGQR